MIEAGFYDEVKQLLEKGYSPELPSMSAIGYQQIAMAISKSTSLEEAVIAMRRLTRQFVRRQRNWFKPDDPEINWFDMREDVEEPISELIMEWMAEVE